MLIHKMALHDLKVGVSFAMNATTIAGPIYPQDKKFTLTYNIFWYHFLNTWLTTTTPMLFFRKVVQKPTPQTISHVV
jgi:hypothetical protein